MVNKDFPCTCGHSKKYHGRYLPHDSIDYCTQCANYNDMYGDKNIPVYHHFEGDNLRYLELLNA